MDLCQRGGSCGMGIEGRKELGGRGSKFPLQCPVYLPEGARRGAVLQNLEHPAAGTGKGDGVGEWVGGLMGRSQRPTQHICNPRMHLHGMPLPHVLHSGAVCRLPHSLAVLWRGCSEGHYQLCSFDIQAPVGLAEEKQVSGTLHMQG